MSRCVDLDEKVTAQFYDQEFEEWTMQTVTIEDVLDSVCNEYTVLPSAQPDEEKVSNILYNIYRNTSPHTSAEGVAAIKYYIAEIWREIYGEEGPRWMKK